MKFKKISTRMLAIIVPALVIAMMILNVISLMNSRDTINEQIGYHMEAELKAADWEITGHLNNVITMAETIASTVADTYQTTTLDTYEKMLEDIIQGNDMVLGSGLWFEPYAYDKEQEYVGPYVYKDGGSIVVTYDYSNADYDYFNQEYYTAAKSLTSANITNPYYDETSGLVMSTCSMPIRVNGSYIGCVTVDMELSSVTEVVEAIKVGKTGDAMLLDSTGIFLAGVSEDVIMAATNVTSDKNASMAKAGSEILSGTSGMTSFKSDEAGEENLYYDTLGATGWKLIIRMPRSEINEPVFKLFAILIIVTIIAVICEIIIVVLQVSNISKGIIHVKSFAGSLADGDFSIKPIEVKSADELGVMSSSLNNMYESNREVISGIAHYAIEIDESSKKLSNASRELTSRFVDIQKLMGNVNEDMMTTSAATEQVNASTEEVLANVSLLADETDASMMMSREIKTRAAAVEAQSRASYDSATKLTHDFGNRLNRSIENAKVVESISELTDVISNIAGQINLLSLNASIEAARAGEAGRGFAVVATEIGSLAGSTSEAVGKIQETISDVQAAFADLTGAANGLLDFLQNTVAPDYNHFVEIADQYGKDADNFEEKAGNISTMSSNIKVIMGEVTNAIQSVAEATQETSDISSQITESIDEASEHVESVYSMSSSQQTIADSLTDTVGRFKLD